MNFRRLILVICTGILVLGMVVPALADNVDAINYYNKAVDLAYQGDYETALVEVDRALQENENFTLAWVTKAGILNTLERYHEGLEASDRAIALDPGNSYAWTNRATSLNGLGMYEEGLAASDMALSLDPESPEAQQNRQIALEMIAKGAQTPEAGLSPFTVILGCAGLMGALLVLKKK